MKKITAIILALMCALSVFTVCASASAEGPTDIFGEPKGFSIKFDIDKFDNVKVFYKPITYKHFNTPGYYTVGNDTPIAVDHDFVCWRDSKGKHYYAGDRLYVDDDIVLYAVWEEKTDNDSHTVRVIKCALNTFQRMILKVLGVIKNIEDFDEEYFTTTEAETTTTEQSAEETTQAAADAA